MERKQRQEGRYYLMCERDWIYFVLIFVAGFLGAFTYVLRGGVFCNAQTGNVVLLGMELGKDDWNGALYYLIPIGAYILGAVVSELLPNPVKHRLAVRWDTLLIAVEMLVIVMLGFLPESAPVQISQVAVNFIASMQYNTFRQAEGVAVATTFVTNHIRQVGVGLAMEWRHRHDAEKPHRRKFLTHLGMLLFFAAGATIGTVFCVQFLGRAIWITLLPLAVVFAVLLHADLTSEKQLVENQKPSGH